MMASSSGRPTHPDVAERYLPSVGDPSPGFGCVSTSGGQKEPVAAVSSQAQPTHSGLSLDQASSPRRGADHLPSTSASTQQNKGEQSSSSAPAYYSEFAKFLLKQQQQQQQEELFSPPPSPEQSSGGQSLVAVTRPCSVKLVNLELRVRRVVSSSSSSVGSSSPPPGMEIANNGGSAKEPTAATKRDMEAGGEGGPILKKSKSDEVIIIDSDREVERVRPAPSSPEITVIKLSNSKGPATPKENVGGAADRKNDVKSPLDTSRSGRTTTPDKISPLKPLSTELGKRPLQQQQDPAASKGSPKNGGSSSSGGGGGSSSNGGMAGPTGGLPGPNTPMDRTDRTSLQCLEQKLKDLQQKHQQKAKTNENHAKTKSMSPSSGLKSGKDAFHRRNEAFIVERKKPLSSPVKKTVKKVSVTPPPHRENKLGGLFCPTTDAKVTILPCKPSARDSEVKVLPSSSSNSVTITKLSSGDTLSVPSKDIKKVFTSKSEMKTKVISGSGSKSEKFSLKGVTKVDKLASGEKGHKEHRPLGPTSRDVSREKSGMLERRERVSSLKIIRCSKCREVFSTKEAKKLHTCNSILDAHYLIDGGDRQKTSPTSSVSASDRSESTSTSLSRSSSRSSSPGIPHAGGVKRSSVMMAAGTDGSGRLKLAKKSEEERMKPGKASPDCDEGDDEDYKGVTAASPAPGKRDSMKEKWVETKSSAHRTEESDGGKRPSGGLIIEAVKTNGGEGEGHKSVKSSGIEILKMERDVRGKDDISADAALFAFSGKRTYSPSMSENTTEGKAESPRETNCKDSPASQADSGVFSIASSASPSKTDTVLNSDVRSPDSPSRSLDQALQSNKQEHNQWKLGTTSVEPKLYQSNSVKSNNALSGKVEGMGDSGIPQGISLPLSTSITRVVPHSASSSTSPYSSSAMVQQPNKSISTMVSSPWQAAALALPNYYSSQLMDDLSRKKRGRPRKNGEPIFSKSRSSKPKTMEDDKDMYDFEVEEDDSKPVQPLRPRRQNAQPVTYKDPDSDEDAKMRLPQAPLIQATQGYREVHHKTQVLSTESGIMEEGLDHHPHHHHHHHGSGGSLEDTSLEDPELEEEEKDKNISYTCSKIEETPKGGIKLKIKIKKSASPAPLDPEPPLKKPKLDSPEGEEEEEAPESFSKTVPPIATSGGGTADTDQEASNIEEIHRLASSLEPSVVPVSAAAQAPVAPDTIPPPPPPSSSSSLKSPLRSPHPHIVSPAGSLAGHAPVSAASKITPGLAGGMQPQNIVANQPHHSPMGASPGRSPSGPSFGFNPNPPPPMHSPVSTASSMEDQMRPYVHPSLQNPYAIQKQSFPPGPNSHLPKNSFDMPQQSYPSGNFGDFSNYNLPYNNYMDPQQSHMYGGQQQAFQPHHLQHLHQQQQQQQQQHMTAFRPGIRPQQRPPTQQQSPFLQGRMLDPRYNHQLSDMDMHGGMGGPPHMGGMGMSVPPHMNPAMMGRHPGMMSPMVGMGGIPVGPYPGPGMAPMPSMSPKHMSLPNLMNSSVMSPLSGHNSGMHPGVMSPQSMSMSERQVVGTPSMSPKSLSMADRMSLPLFPASQFRMSSPQYGQPAGGPAPSFSHSPTYPSSQGYPRPPTPQSYKPPTPQNYQLSPTPHSHPKPPTPQGSQNPTTPGSYHNPSTPGGGYTNPGTPMQNPLTPQSYDPPTPQQSSQSQQLNNSFDGPPSVGGGGGASSLPQPVIQPNPLAAGGHGGTAASSCPSTAFIVPKTESVIHSPVHNIFSKDCSKISTPMLSPPSTTSSLRKIRRPSKSVTPGTVSPGQKSLSPIHGKEVVKLESDMIVPKKEPPSSPPMESTEETARASMAETGCLAVKTEPCEPLSPGQSAESSDSTFESAPPPPAPPEMTIKQEAAAPPRSPTPPRDATPPPKAATPEPPKEPRWGEDGLEGMPRRALKRIFTYVCHSEGCLPFLPNAMLVCKLWNEVAVDPTLWTHANLGSAIKEKVRSEKKLEWILKNKFPHAVDVDVTGWKAVMSAPALKIIAANCPKVSGLGLSNCVKLNYEDIRIVPSLFPNLERIDLSLVSPSTASSRSAVSSSALSDLITALGEKLTHFNMSSNKMAGLPFVFKALSQHAKNLRFLDVSNISTTSRDTILINIEKLQKGCPRLTTFRTTNTMLGLNEAPVREQVMSPGFPCLEELTIGVDQRGYFDGMDDSQIERILKRSNRLRLLDIRGCKGISDSTLVRLPFWDLEYLYVAGCSVTSSSRDGLELLVKKWRRTLIELDIGLTPDARTVDWAVLALVEDDEKLKLRKLNLNGTGVNLKPLTKLLSCCPTLSSLNLTSCRALPRGMKRMYHSREDVAALCQGIADGKFNDNGSEEDD